MSVVSSLKLTVVDGCSLEEELRNILLPAQVIKDFEGHERVLPRYFYEIPDRQTANETNLTEHFAICEFLSTDVREAERLHSYPQYIPCSIVLLAHTLEAFRERCSSFVHIAANGGYRSPSHKLNRQASTHSWGTAANIYRIGDDSLTEKEKIEKYIKLAAQSIPGAFVREFGRSTGYADDHLHIDLGYTLYEPPVSKR